MDHKNKAIPKPNAFDVNKAQMRCACKAIAMHAGPACTSTPVKIRKPDRRAGTEEDRAMADTIATLPPLFQRRTSCISMSWPRDVEAVFASRAV